MILNAIKIFLKSGRVLLAVLMFGELYVNAAEQQPNIRGALSFLDPRNGKIDKLTREKVALEELVQGQEDEAERHLGEIRKQNDLLRVMEKDLAAARAKQERTQRAYQDTSVENEQLHLTLAHMKTSFRALRERKENDSIAGASRAVVDAFDPRFLEQKAAKMQAERELRDYEETLALQKEKEERERQEATKRIEEERQKQERERLQREEELRKQHELEESLRAAAAVALHTTVSHANGATVDDTLGASAAATGSQLVESEEEDNQGQIGKSTDSNKKRRNKKKRNGRGGKR